MKNKFLKSVFKVLLLVVIVAAVAHWAPETLAQLEEGGSGLSIPQGDATINEDIDKRPLADVVLSMVNYFIGFLGFIAVIMFVYAGVLWVVSSGNEESISKAKKIMMYAALGIVIVILSFSIVRFITSSAGPGQTCSIDADCPNNGICNENNFCEAQAEGGNTCQTNTDCAQGFTCTNNLCQFPVGFVCLTSVDCSPGQYCGDDSTCKDGESQICEVNSDCDAPEQCDGFGFCHNPNGGSGAQCSDNTDCATGYVCNQDQNQCEIQGGGGGQGINGGESQGIAIETIGQMDVSIDELVSELSDLSDEVEDLDNALKNAINNILSQGSLNEKITGLSELPTTPDQNLLPLIDENVVVILDRLISALQKLELLQEQLATLKTVMPESTATNQAWNETDGALNTLIGNPISKILITQLQSNYNELKELILTFPAVRSQIRAVPAQGNVPFTVSFDGLDSSDPTGGTITHYVWTFIDADGQEKFLTDQTDQAFVTHEFTEPNTYLVRLQVATNNEDEDGYKAAMDGVSTVLIKALPPDSKVAFTVNNMEPLDVHNVTLEEATAGLEFNPEITQAAPGRTIVEYEWFFGDATREERTLPTPVIHSYTEQGEYFITLMVTDDTGVKDKRVVKIIVKPLAAQADFEPAQGDVNTEFSFTGIESRSDIGTITDYEWQIYDEENVVVAQSPDESFDHTFEKPGYYTVELVITDTTGAQDKMVRQLEVVSRDPVATFTYEVPDVNKPNTLTFDASNSYDPDQGDAITYSWDFDGDGQFEIVGTEELTATHQYRRTGTFKAILQVQDAFGKSDQFEEVITIDSILTSEIEVDKKAVQLGEEVTFTAANSTAVAYLWEFGDGETLSTTQNTATHTYTEEGKYQVKLNFFDREDNDNSVTTHILVAEGDNPIALGEARVNEKNLALTEDLCGEGADGYIVNRSQNIFLTAENSVNRDGSGRLLAYNWEFSDGQSDTRKEFIQRFPELSEPGQCYSVELTVRDELSGKLSNEDLLYFKVINQTPTIRDFVIVDEGDTQLTTPTKVQLRIVDPQDVDGQVGKYRWWYYREGFETQQLGLHSTITPETEMVLTAQGETGVTNKYFFVAEIIDNDNGIFDTTERFGEISYLEATNGPNLSPVSAFTPDKTTISVGDSITFVSEAYDPQGEALPNGAYEWDFDGDGSYDDRTSGPQVSRQYNTPGEYEVRLRVVHRGLSTTARQTIFVEPTNSYPQASFSYTIEGNTVTFSAEQSAYDKDLEDSTLRFEWDFDVTDDANGNGVNDDDVESVEATPTISYPQTQPYRIKLTVKDSLGNEGVAVRDVDLTLSSEDRERNTRKSLGLRAPNQPITLLNVSVSPFQINRGNTADIIARVQNADNSDYNGSVFFELLEGTGEFSPTPVQAVDSKAQSVFTAIDPGRIRIRVTATDTYYGDIQEELFIDVL